MATRAEDTKRQRRQVAALEEDQVAALKDRLLPVPPALLPAVAPAASSIPASLQMLSLPPRPGTAQCQQPCVEMPLEWQGAPPPPQRGLAGVQLPWTALPARRAADLLPETSTGLPGPTEGLEPVEIKREVKARHAVSDLVCPEVGQSSAGRAGARHPGWQS